jgi:hypothetical protein
MPAGEPFPPRREEDRGPVRRPRRRDDDDDYDDLPRRRRRYDYEPHRGTVILVLGILSLVVAQIILGPIAWIMGNNDLREIREGRMDPEGEANTNAGRICGMIGTILGVCFLCCGVSYVLFIIGIVGAGVRHGF